MSAKIRIETVHELECPARELTAEVLESFLSRLDNQDVIEIRKVDSQRPGDVSMVYLKAKLNKGVPKKSVQEQ